MAINPIHVSGTPENNSVVAVNVRIYYPAGTPDEDIFDDVNRALGESSRIVGAYMMLSDGFGHLVPDDKPIA
jgi:hypothetical protein